MKKCPQCGQSIPDTAEFCVKCGQKIETHPQDVSKTTPPAKTANQKPKKSKTALILGVIGGCLVLTVVFIITAFLIWRAVSTEQPSEPGEEAVEEASNIEVTWESPEKIPTAFYTNPHEKLITFKLKADQPTQVTISVEIPKITEKETRQVEIGPEETTEEFKPPILTSAYGPLDKAQDKNINIKVVDEQGNEIVNTSQKITLLSRNDMIWVSEDGTNNQKYIAHWVTPDNKEVKELVRVAAEYNQQFCDSHAMVGYQGGETLVLCQLASIFAAMRDHYQIAYISSPESYTTSNAQSIKLPEEVIMENSGLCIETVVTVAAALENLGMEPVIILIPGHAWVAVRTAPGSPNYFHLETTMLDAPVLDALTFAEENWAQNSGNATVIDIKEAREDGILPFGAPETEKTNL